MRKQSLLVAALVAAAISACTKKADDTPSPAASAVTKTVSNLDADTTRRDPATGTPVGATGRYTLYSLETGALVSNNDSASSRWDIGFRGTNIIVNGGSSGPGQGGAAVLTGLFSEISQFQTGPAGLTGVLTGNIVVPFQRDSATGTTPLAIPNASGAGWYNYNASSNTITPVPGRILAIRTANGGWAKVEIISYYKGAPATPNQTSAARWYSFRYSFQQNGSF